MPKFLSLPRRSTDSGRLVGRANKLPICLHVTLLFPSRNYCRQSGPWKCPRSVPEATSDLETSKKPHQRREHLLHVSLHVPFTDLHGLQVFFIFFQTSQTPSRFPSRTLHGPSRIATFWKTHVWGFRRLLSKWSQHFRKDLLFLQATGFLTIVIYMYIYIYI